MSNAIDLTPETIETITRLIAEKADGIEYDINIPREAHETVTKGAPLMWAKVLEFEYQYVDSAQEVGVPEEVFHETDLDIDTLIDANDAYQIDQFFLPSGEGKPLSLQDFQVALFRAITDDLNSAWMDAIRKVVKEVHGEDPLGGGDGLTFPAHK